MKKIISLFAIAIAFACSDSTAPKAFTPCTAAIDSAVAKLGTPVHADTVTADSILELQKVKSSIATFEWVKIHRERYDDVDKTTTVSTFAWKSNLPVCSISTVITKDD